MKDVATSPGLFTSALNIFSHDSDSLSLYIYIQYSVQRWHCSAISLCQVSLEILQQPG